MTSFTLVAPDPANLSVGDPILIDTRPATDYWAGHLAGARHLDPALLALQRTDNASIIRFQALLAWSLSTLGIGTRKVLVYGAAAEVNVSRVAWALGYAGVADIALLDGGLAALGNVPLTTEAPVVHAAPFRLQPVASFLATAEQAQAAGDSQQAGRLVDAREHDEYVGLRSNARRNGRIPGAAFWDTRKEIDARGQFRPAHELGQDFAGLAGHDQPLVAYCGGGGRAARTFVALQLAGYTQAAVYPASWNEWGNLDNLPIETGTSHTAAA
ncbi:MAG TPA: rhodanese-like domain-containing protein [Burkholderiaceae bacterium]